MRSNPQKMPRLMLANSVEKSEAANTKTAKKKTIELET